MNKINILLTRIGDWDQYIQICQRGKELIEEEIEKVKTNDDKVIMEQDKKLLDGATKTAWESRKNRFPTLYDLGQILLALSIQSTDVERVCKAQDLIHLKSRNSSKHLNV